jgi:hypothetical protein
VELKARLYSRVVPLVCTSFMYNTLTVLAYGREALAVLPRHVAKKKSEPVIHFDNWHIHLTASTKPVLKTRSTDMLQLVVAGVVLFVSTFVTFMVWPVSCRSRWNPSGRVRVFSPPLSHAERLLTETGLALLRHWRLDWPWPGTGHSSHEERC